MASNSLPKNRPAPGPVKTELEVTPMTLGDLARARAAKGEPVPYDRLVSEIATLQCVHATLSEADLSDRSDKWSNIGSAELVLCQLIGRLHDIANDVLTMQERLHAEEARHAAA